ncbi:Protein abrupt, partial [Fragariocoptes setiger]
DGEFEDDHIQFELSVYEDACSKTHALLKLSERNQRYLAVLLQELKKRNERGLVIERVLGKLASFNHCYEGDFDDAMVPIVQDLANFIREFARDVNRELSDRIAYRREKLKWSLLSMMLYRERSKICRKYGLTIDVAKFVIEMKKNNIDVGITTDEKEDTRGMTSMMDDIKSARHKNLGYLVNPFAKTFGRLVKVSELSSKGEHATAFYNGALKKVCGLFSNLLVRRSGQPIVDVTLFYNWIFDLFARRNPRDRSRTHPLFEDIHRISSKFWSSNIHFYLMFGCRYMAETAVDPVGGVIKMPDNHQIETMSSTRLIPEEEEDDDNEGGEDDEEVMAAQQQHQSSTAHSSLADRHNRGLDSANQQHDLGRPDVTIACEGGSFNAHRTILSSRSCYLRRLLVEFSERYPSQQPVVILNDLKLGDIRSLINYMYNNKLNVPFEPSSSIEQAAKILCIDSLLGIRSEHATTYSTDVHRVIALDQRFDQMNDIELSTDSHQSHSFLPQSLANLDQGVAAVAAAAASAHQNTNQQQSLRATIPIHNLAQCGAGGSQSNINSALMHNYIEPSMAPSSANRKKQRKPASSRLPLSGTNNQHTFAQSNIIPSHQNRSSRAGNDSTFLEPSSHILMSNNFGRSDATLMLNNKKHKKSRHQHQPEIYMERLTRIPYQSYLSQDDEQQVQFATTYEEHTSRCCSYTSVGIDKASAEESCEAQSVPILQQNSLT